MESNPILSHLYVINLFHWKIQISCGWVNVMWGMICRIAGAGTICHTVMNVEIQPTFLQRSFVGLRVHTGYWAGADCISYSPALWTLSSGWHQGDFDKTGGASSAIHPQVVGCEFHLYVSHGYYCIRICIISSNRMPYQYEKEHHKFRVHCNIVRFIGFPTDQ